MAPVVHKCFAQQGFFFCPPVFLLRYILSSTFVRWSVLICVSTICFCSWLSVFFVCQHFLFVCLCLCSRLAMICCTRSHCWLCNHVCGAAMAKHIAGHCS